jgi:hypothetical protein
MRGGEIGRPPHRPPRGDHRGPRPPQRKEGGGEIDRRRRVERQRGGCRAEQHDGLPVIPDRLQPDAVAQLQQRIVRCQQGRRMQGGQRPGTITQPQLAQAQKAKAFRVSRADQALKRVHRTGIMPRRVEALGRLEARIFIDGHVLTAFTGTSGLTKERMRQWRKPGKRGSPHA